MDDTIIVTVPLTRAEFETLRQLAQHQFRTAPDQARYLLRCALLGDQSTVINDKPVENDDDPSTVKVTK